MKIIIVGANGTIGKHVRKALEGSGRELVLVGKKSGDYHLNIENADEVSAFYKKIGNFDAVVNASGDVAFAPLQALKKEDWTRSFQSKLMGQINLVQQGIPFINEKGSFTLVSGILSEEYILAGVAATTVNAAIEGFARAAACELPKGIRINVVSPTLLKDSLGVYGDYFPGFAAVDGAKVGQAYKRSVFGIETGKIFRLFE